MTTWVISRMENGSGPWRIIYTGHDKRKGLCVARMDAEPWRPNWKVHIRCETAEQWAARNEAACALWRLCE